MRIIFLAFLMGCSSDDKRWVSDIFNHSTIPQAILIGALMVSIAVILK